MDDFSRNIEDKLAKLIDGKKLPDVQAALKTLIDSGFNAPDIFQMMGGLNQPNASIGSEPKKSKESDSSPTFNIFTTMGGLNQPDKPIGTKQSESDDPSIKVSAPDLFGMMGGLNQPNTPIGTKSSDSEEEPESSASPNLFKMMGGLNQPDAPIGSKTPEGEKATKEALANYFKLKGGLNQPDIAAAAAAAKSETESPKTTEEAIEETLKPVSEAVVESEAKPEQKAGSETEASTTESAPSRREEVAAKRMKAAEVARSMATEEAPAEEKADYTQMAIDLFKNTHGTEFDPKSSKDKGKLQNMVSMLEQDGGAKGRTPNQIALEFYRRFPSN